MTSTPPSWQNLKGPKVESVVKACSGVRSWLMEINDPVTMKAEDFGPAKCNPVLEQRENGNIDATVHGNGFANARGGGFDEPNTSWPEQTPRAPWEASQAPKDAESTESNMQNGHSDVDLTAVKPKVVSTPNGISNASELHANSEMCAPVHETNAKAGNTSPSRAIDESPAAETQNMEDGQLDSPGQEVPSVKSWIEGVQKSPVTPCLEDSTRDPLTGEPIIAVHYPDTFANPLDKQCPKNDLQAQALSQMMRRLVETMLREKMYDRVPSKASIDNEPDFPKADITLRPAEISDLDEVAELIKKERLNQKGPESQDVDTSYVKRVFNYCKRQMRPFIVAVLPEDVLLDRSKWPADSQDAYERYVKYQTEISHDECRTPVVGFAFVDGRQSGMLVGGDAANYSGYITLLVHSDHRRRKIGSALLDRILLSVAPYHRSHIDYKWQCGKPAQVYEHPAANNAREYTTVYLESFQDSESADTAPFNKALLERFGFRQVGRLSRAKKETLGPVTVWHDLLLWELDVQPPSNLR